MFEVKIQQTSNEMTQTKAGFATSSYKRGEFKVIKFNVTIKIALRVN